MNYVLMEMEIRVYKYNHFHFHRSRVVHGGKNGALKRPHFYRLHVHPRTSASDGMEEM